MQLIFGAAAIVFLFNLLREIHVYRSIKNVFTCEHCGTLNETISGIHKCYKCHRSFKIKDKQWEHLILHRVTWLDTSSKTKELNFNEYTKVPKIEITISILATIILVAGVVINII